MATRKSPHLRKARTAAAGSWLALLAVTTLGDAADTVRAQVRAQGLPSSGNYRLVVQSYDATGHDARPVGSMQRSVSADELRNGVNVNLLELRESANLGSAQSPMVMAWIEAGEPDLEFDGRTARPSPGSVYGVARRDVSHGVVQIRLNRKA
ncbi:MAG TPA: hypothetical protein VHV30_15015 [Polyangiaceae bacterium]|jgi:hypothetical protein|nr:hypothetical protein [Polyangiaceae bacterium]